jgi:hypothetical protein
LQHPSDDDSDPDYFLVSYSRYCRCEAGETRGVVNTAQEAFDELRLQSDDIQGVDHRLDHRSMSFDVVRCMSLLSSKDTKKPPSSAWRRAGLLIFGGCDEDEARGWTHGVHDFKQTRLKIKRANRNNT